MISLTDREAAELYDLWHEKVATAVRRAHAKANGRRDTHDTDLAALRRDLTAINLHTLEAPESDAAPGTALDTAHSAKRFLAYAEDDHARAEHVPAILWLQAAYMGAQLAIEIEERSARKSPPTPRPEPQHAPDKPWWQLDIPRQDKQ